jgi:hypothetical protein
MKAFSSTVRRWISWWERDQSASRIVVNPTASFILYLGTFAKLRKATISFVVSVRMRQLGSLWADFHGIWYWSIFLKCVEKMNFIIFIKIWQEKRYYTSRPLSVFGNTSLTSPESDKSFRKNLYRKSNHTFYVKFFLKKIVPFVG